MVTRQSATAHLNSVTVAPVTSAIRGVPSEVRLDLEDGMKQPGAVNLHHLVTVSKGALGRCLARLDRNKMAEVCRALAFALECDG